MVAGWISLHRQIQDHWIWQDANKLKWWIDILLTVNNAPGKVQLGNEVFVCNRAESLLSLQSWASRWHVSKDTARNFMTLLENDQMIIRVSIGKSTRLTVCKYDDYQVSSHVNQTHAVQTTNTNNKVNNEDKVISVDFNEFWNLYGRKVGDKKGAIKKWEKLTKQTKDMIMEILPEWKKQFSNVQYQPFPETFLNQERWNDEFLINHKPVLKLVNGQKILDQSNNVKLFD